MIHLTPAALQEIKRLQRSRHQERRYFRLGVLPGGCLDYYYTLNLAEDYAEGDQEYEQDGVVILIDPQGAQWLRGLKVDYAEDLMGGGFRFSNPNVAAACSCSLSFQPTSADRDGGPN
ncbi:MAG: HesB/IscA family protein [Cyanobacteriota bacterium]|jgi:iron-sulfur cluster assembly protein